VIHGITITLVIVVFLDITFEIKWKNFLYGMDWIEIKINHWIQIEMKYSIGMKSKYHSLLFKGKMAFEFYCTLIFKTLKID